MKQTVTALVTQMVGRLMDAVIAEQGIEALEVPRL